jgi:hypothetical protein
MKNKESVLEREKLKLEREIQTANLRIAERKVALEENAHELAKAQHDLATAEHARDQWRNPLVVAIFAATIAAAGNAVIAFSNGVLQRHLEAQKAESARILEMIKTDGDADKAAENLDFLIQSGLVDDINRLQKLRAFLNSREPGSGPSTSAGSAVLSMSTLPDEFNCRMPSEPREVTEIILTDTDTLSVAEEVRNLRMLRGSYHYLIDESGLIYSLVPEDCIAFHAFQRNAASVGIGILHKLGTEYSVAQLEALKKLLSEIAGRHGISPTKLLSIKNVRPERSVDISAHMTDLRAAIGK